MAAATWRDIKDLAWRPAEAFEDILLRQGLGLSLALGMLSYYISTLQMSELLLPRQRGGWGYVLLNGPLALARLVLLVSLFHVAARLLSQRRGRWRDLLALWGYTQLPHLGLTILALALFATLPLASGRGEEVLRIVALGGIALGLALWGVLLKLQALKICYHLRGGRLAAVVVLAVSVYAAYGWLERTLIYERGVVPRALVSAMDPAAPQAVSGWRNLVLPLDRLTYRLRPPARGEVVGFVPPGREADMPWALGYRARSIARVVGLPGERVEVRRGQVRLDGQPLDEPYRQGLGAHAIDVPPTTLPPGHVLLLGDNRAQAVEVYGGGVVPYPAIRGRLTEVGRWKWRLVVHTWLW
jgi:signal peptidase I